MSYNNTNDIVEYKQGNSTIKIKRKKKTSRDNIDYIYVNIKYFEPVTTLVPTVANFDITRVDNILDKSSDYKLSIIRWNIPINFPSLLMPEQSVLNSDFNVALTFGSTTITEPIVFVDLAIGDFYPRGIYAITQYVDMLNIAYEKCHNQLKIIESGYTALIPPVVHFDPNSINKISLWCPIEFIDTNTNNALISIQIKAQQLGLQGIPNTANFNLTPPLNICNINFNVHLDLTNYYKTQAPYPIQEFIILQSEFDPTSAFNKLNNLLFETSSIPVSQEIVGKENSVLRKVVSDYYLGGAEPVNIGDSIYYNPTVLRWYNLNSDLELRNIDIRPLIEFSDGQIFPVYIQANQSWGCKVLFQRLTPIQKLGFQMTKSLSLKDEQEFKEELNDEF